MFAWNHPVMYDKCATDCTMLGRNILNPKPCLNHKSEHRSLETFGKSKEKQAPSQVQPLLPKQEVPW